MPAEFIIVLNTVLKIFGFTLAHSCMSKLSTHANKGPNRVSAHRGLTVSSKKAALGTAQPHLVYCLLQLCIRFVRKLFIEKYFPGSYLNQWLSRYLITYIILFIFARVRRKKDKNLFPIKAGKNVVL